MDQVEKIQETIEMLERVRDKLLAAGQGPFMSNELFDQIDSLYSKLIALDSHGDEAF